MRIGDAWNYMKGYAKKQVHDGISIVTPITENGREVLDSIVEYIYVRKTERVPNTPIASDASELIWDCIRNLDTIIDDAIGSYNSVGIGRQALRKISNLLSSNDRVHLFIG